MDFPVAARLDASRVFFTFRAPPATALEPTTVPLFLPESLTFFNKLN